MIERRRHSDRSKQFQHQIDKKVPNDNCKVYNSQDDSESGELPLAASCDHSALDDSDTVCLKTCFSKLHYGQRTSNDFSNTKLIRKRETKVKVKEEEMSYSD